MFTFSDLRSLCLERFKAALNSTTLGRIRAPFHCAGRTRSKSVFGDLLINRSGNVAMMYALTLPVLLLGGAAAIDYSRAAWFIPS